MLPSACQVPPRPAGARASVCGAPPPRSMRFIVPAAKKPTERPSGDQNGYVAPSVPPSGLAAEAPRSRSHSPTPLSPPAA